MSAVDRFCEAVEHGAFPVPGVFGDDVVFDATVPNWRFRVHGAEAVGRQLAGWFAGPGRFEHLTRAPLPDGELVEFTLTWTERGIPHAAHQAHVLRVADGRIVSDVAFCGGRWPASLLAEMEEAGHAH